MAVACAPAVAPVGLHPSVIADSPRESAGLRNPQYPVSPRHIHREPEQIAGAVGQSMTASSSASARTVRAVVVYQHTLLRDIAVRLLTKAGVEVAATISATDLGLAEVVALQPDVVVVDRAAAGGVQTLCQSSLQVGQAGSAQRIVLIGLADSTMIVCHRRLVVEATAQNLVEAVLGLLTTVPNKPQG